MNKFIKYSARILLGIFIAILFVLGVLRMPFIQTAMGNLVTNKLAETLGADFNINQIKINFIDNVQLRGVYLEDQNLDTLLYVEKLEVDIQLWSLLKKEINVDEIYLDKAVLRLSQNTDSIYNYEFILEAFTSDTPSTSKEFPFTLHLDELNVNRLDFTLDLVSGKNSIQAKQILVQVNSLDVNELTFDIESILLDQPSFSGNWKATEVQQETITVNSETISFPFATLPVKVTCSALVIHNGDAMFKQGEIINTKGFDYRDFALSELNFEASELELSHDLLRMEIPNSSLCLNDSLSLNKLKVNIAFAEDYFSLDDLVLNYNLSEVTLMGDGAYQSFNDLLNLNEQSKLDIQVAKIRLAVSDALYFVPQLDTIPAIHRLKDESIFLTSALSGNLKKVVLDSVELKWLNSKISINGALRNLDNVDQMEFDEIKVLAQTRASDVRKILGKNLIPSKYNKLGEVILNGHLRGSLSELNILALDLKSKGKTKLEILGKVNSILDIEKLSYQLNVKQLNSGVADAAIFLDSIPTILQAITSISYQGTIAGGLRNYDLNGSWTSTVGNLDTDLEITFNETFSHASYRGDAILKQLEIGKLLGVDSLGSISLTVNVEGEGLTLDSLDATLDAHISEVDFNSYNYENILVQGTFKKSMFEGLIEIQDKNLDFNFDGMVDLNDSLPQFNFQANLVKLDAAAIHLTSYPLDVSFSVDANLVGQNIDDLEGDIKIKQLQLGNNVKRWQTDSIVFSARQKNLENRVFEVVSSFLNLRAEGNYSFSSIPKIILSLGDEYFPFSSIIQGGAVTAEEQLKLKDEYIKIDARLIDAPNLASFFNLDLQELDSLNLHLLLDAAENLIDIKLEFPSLEYQNLRVDKFLFEAKSEADNLLTNLSIDSISYGEIAYIPELEVNGVFKDKIALLNTRIQTDTSDVSLNLNTTVFQQNGLIGLEVNPPFTLNSKDWDLVQNEPIFLNSSAPKKIAIELSNHAERIRLGSDLKTLTVDFENFGLENLTSLVQLDSVDIMGEMNGSIGVSRVDSNMLIVSDLELIDLAINDAVLGRLTLNVEKKNNDVNGLLLLKGLKNNISATMNYDLASKNIDANLDMEALDLEAFGIFLKTYLDAVKGSIAANIDVKGSLNEPIINGEISFNKVSAKVKSLGTTYGIEKGQVAVNKTTFSPKVILTDQANRKAYLTGEIRHDFFRDLKFKLKFDSDAFAFLNSPKLEDALFYGKLIASAHASIEGNLDLPVIKGKVVTMPETNLFVQLLTEKSIASQEEYIVFVNGTDYQTEALDSIANARYKIKSNIDLNLNIQVNEKTKLNLIIDPLTGDNLELVGSGLFTVLIPPKGDMNITGVYTVSEGLYRFSFQKFLKRKFNIIKGSTISFTGNPLNAQLDIKAAYNTEASTYALVEGQGISLSSEEERQFKKKTDVAVGLAIKGRLESPELSFDISLPSSSSTPIGGSAARALNQIKSNESDLNKQVFSLLLFNSFAGGSSNGNISSTGSSTAVRSVGNLISQQLNNLASKAKGLQIDFNLDQYQDQFSETNAQITEVDVGISQSLIDDRLTISIGGNVDLESSNQKDGALGNVAGDFVLEYKLSKNGKYTVQVFQKSDYDALNDANLWKTGAGFQYQTKFGKVLNKNRKKKEH